MAEQDFGLSFNLMDVRACYYDVCIICIHYEVNSCIYIWEIIYINLINRRGPIVQGIFAKIGPDLELRWWDLISSPVDSIVPLVSPKKVTDPTLWGKMIFRPRLFHF